MISTPVFFDGGVGGFDTLIVDGNPITPIADSIYRPGPTVDAGTLEYLNADSEFLMGLQFQNLEPVVDSTYAGTQTVSAGDNDNQITYELRNAHLDEGFVLVDRNERLKIYNKTELVLSGGAGDDHYTLDLSLASGYGPLSPTSLSLKRIRIVDQARLPAKNSLLYPFSDVDTLGQDRLEIVPPESQVEVDLATHQFRFPDSLGQTVLEVDFSGHRRPPMTEFDGAIEEVFVSGYGSASSLKLLGTESRETLTLSNNGSNEHFQLGLTSESIHSPTYNFAQFGQLDADLKAGLDSVVFNGTDLADAVAIEQGNNPTDTKLSWTGPSQSVNFASLDRLQLNLHGGDDIVDVYSKPRDVAFGPTLPVNGDIQIDAGSGTDTVQLWGNRTGLHTEFTPGPLHDQATVSVETQSILTTAVESFIDQAHGRLSIVGTDAANSVSLSSLITIDEFPEYEFKNKTQVSFDALGGRDEVSVSTIIPQLNGPLSINGGNISEGDLLTIQGSTLDDWMTYSPHPTDPHAGTFVRNGFVGQSGTVDPLVVNFLGFADAMVEGFTGDDSFEAVAINPQISVASANMRTILSSYEKLSSIPTESEGSNAATRFCPVSLIAFICFRAT